jgi:FeS assembly SUF system regulator
MLKLSKKADYALIALRHLALHNGHRAWSAAEIARIYGISAPLMAKVLQRLARSGLVEARQGSGGGYLLARDPAQITALDVVRSIDGPLAIASCFSAQGACEQSLTCTVREPLRQVNESILAMLDRMTILEMIQEPPARVVELRS